MLELHCHTTCSDGSLSPTELVAAAAAAGVKALAISDHDTMQGWEEACRAGDSWDIEIVPALELSTVWLGRSLHILGFYPDRERLAGPLEERRQGRIRRAEAIVAKLAELGYPIVLPETKLTPCRPHIAQALVEAGHVRTSREAFDRFLHDDGPAFVPYEKFSAIDGIQLLRSCGAVPVWAHPYLFQGDSVARTLPALLEAGLMGLEAYHPEHNQGRIRELEILAERHDLVLSGGSDYHGPNPRGHNLNLFRLGLDRLEKLRAHHRQLAKTLSESGSEGLSMQTTL